MTVIPSAAEFHLKEKSFISIIYSLPSDAGFTVLHTYTQKGQPIDSAVLCGEWIVDEGVETSFATRIDSDGSITNNDTLFSAVLNKDGNVLAGTDSVRVRIHRSILEETGHFRVLSDTSFSFLWNDDSHWFACD
jgi:hypothetical protein